MSIFEGKKEKNTDLVLKRARRSARKIVEDANLKAAKIIQEAEIFTLEARQYADRALIEAAGASAEKMAEELKNEFNARETGLEKAVGAEYEKVKSEIAGYKLQKMKEIEVKTRGVIREVVEEFFTEALDTKKEEEILLKALENAKHIL